MAAAEHETIARVALEIAEERRALLDRIRSALVRGDEGEALRLMRTYTGLDDAEGYRADPRFN